MPVGRPAGNCEPSGAWSCAPVAGAEMIGAHGKNEGALRKTQRALMQSKRAKRFNGDRSRAAELKMPNRKLQEIGKSCKGSHGKTVLVAVQRSLRVNLVRAGMASRWPAASGASRTQASPRPRRLDHFPAEFFRAFVCGKKATSGERLKIHWGSTVNDVCHKFEPGRGRDVKITKSKMSQAARAIALCCVLVWGIVFAQASRCFGQAQTQA